MLTVPSTYVARQSNGEYGSYEAGKPASQVSMNRNPLRRIESGDWSNRRTQNTLMDFAVDLKPVKGLTVTGEMFYRIWDSEKLKRILQVVRRSKISLPARS